MKMKTKKSMTDEEIFKGVTDQHSFLDDAIRKAIQLTHESEQEKLKDNEYLIRIWKQGKAQAEAEFLKKVNEEIKNNIDWLRKLKPENYGEFVGMLVLIKGNILAPQEGDKI